MRQSFEEWLKENKFKPIRPIYYGSFEHWLSKKSPIQIIQYAEEWSSQQTEDEVVEALKKIAELDPTKDAPKNQFCYDEWGEAECFNKAKDIAKAILARKGNKDGEKGG